jgi:hypothetical protein
MGFLRSVAARDVLTMLATLLYLCGAGEDAAERLNLPVTRSAVRAVALTPRLIP